MDDYKRDVTDPGVKFSQWAHVVCRGSHKNSPALTVIDPRTDSFRGTRGWRWDKPILREMLAGTVYEECQSDGAGGKLQFHALLGTPEAFVGAACEALTMCIDDTAAGGGLPVAILSSNIDVKGITKENWHLCKALLKGLETQLRNQKLALLTGETAIMKHNITAFCDTSARGQLIMTWSMTSLGLASELLSPNGSTIRPGMPIIGLRDMGYRCNGGTKFTNILMGKWGPSIDDIRSSDVAMAFVQKLVEPSRSYAHTIARLRGWQIDGTHGDSLARIHGVAHITGGGIWGKLPEILPEGVGADLAQMPGPAYVLLQAQRYAEDIGQPMSDHECHGTFHGGCGMMVICDEADVQTVLEESRRDGHEPFIIGETTASEKGEITIDSQFAEGGRLSSLNPPK